MHLNVREVSQLLKVSERKVREWIKQGILRADRVNDQYRLRRSDLLEQTCSREINAPAAVFEESAPAGLTLSLTDALRSGGVFHGVPGPDQRSALRAIVTSLSLPTNGDRVALSNLLLAREALGSTAIGDGIAIPHLRRPILVPGACSSVSLHFLENPIDFGASDGRPVFAIFLLISATARTHLRLLSRLSFALHDPHLREALEWRVTQDKILAEFARIDSVSARIPQTIDSGKRLT